VANERGFEHPVRAQRPLKSRNLFPLRSPLQNPYSMKHLLRDSAGAEPELDARIRVRRHSRREVSPWSAYSNAVDRLTGLRPNPNLGEGYYEDNTQNTVYTSWQTSLRKRYSRNLTGGFHYTWGKKSFDSRRRHRGVLSGRHRPSHAGLLNPEPTWSVGRDIAHYFAFDIVYELAASDGRRPLVRYTLGWLEASSIFSGHVGPAAADYADSSLQVTAGLHRWKPILSDNREHWQYLNRAPSRLCRSARIGPASVRKRRQREVRGPGLVNMDFSLAKNVEIGDGSVPASR